MRWQWRFHDRNGERALTRGDDSASVCSLAFEMWLDGVDVDALENPERLAGLLNYQSDLTLREIVGQLDVDELAAIGVTANKTDEWVFSYRGDPLRVHRERLDDDGSNDENERHEFAEMTHTEFVDFVDSMTNEGGEVDDSSDCRRD